MNKHDVAEIRETLRTHTERRNDSLGKFDGDSIGIGRFVPGSSPWERHNNGDELLLVTDGEVQIEVLEDDGGSWIERLEEGTLFVVPKGRWHQLTAEDCVSILYVSPGEEGVERRRERPFQRTEG